MNIIKLRGFAKCINGSGMMTLATPSITIIGPGPLNYCRLVEFELPQCIAHYVFIVFIRSIIPLVGKHQVFGN